jgi:hypothetical protein
MDQYVGNTMIREDKIRIYEPIDSNNFIVSDKNLEITIEPSIIDSGNNFTFKNKSNEVIKIIWDESAYLSPEGSSLGLYHVGNKIADRSSSKPPTIIIPNGTHKDSVGISSLVKFSGQHWTHTPMCGKQDYFKHNLDATMCKNKIFGYFFTYEKNGTKNNLTIKFKYIGSKPKKKK